MERRDFLAAAAAAASSRRCSSSPLSAKLGDIGLATITVAKGMTRGAGGDARGVAEIGYSGDRVEPAVWQHGAEMRGHDAEESRASLSGAAHPVGDLTDANWPGGDRTRAHVLGARYSSVRRSRRRCGPRAPGSRSSPRSSIGQGAEARRRGRHPRLPQPCRRVRAGRWCAGALRRFLDETDRDLMQLELDCYWVTKAGHDPVAWLLRNPGRVAGAAHQGHGDGWRLCGCWRGHHRLPPDLSRAEACRGEALPGRA